MSVVFLESAIVHYEVLGKGRPVFFLHGWVGSWKYWIPSMQVAATSYRAYALDLWGFGETAHNQQAYQLDQQMDLLRAFIDIMNTPDGKLLIQTVYGIDAFRPADDSLYDQFRIYVEASGLDINTLIK